MDYQTYIRSPRWKATREWALERAGRACQLCPSKDRLEVHHRTYERLGEELPGDLIVLCASCHQRHHGIVPPPLVGPKVKYADVLERITAADWSSIESVRKALAELAPMLACLDDQWRDLAIVRICSRCGLDSNTVRSEIARARGVAA